MSSADGGHSIEMGYRFTAVTLPRYDTVNVSRSTRASSRRSTVSTKLLQWNWVWNPRMLEPSRPSSSSSPHGQIPNAYGLGHGMCQKAKIVAVGSAFWIILGSNAE